MFFNKRFCILLGNSTLNLMNMDIQFIFFQQVYYNTLLHNTNKQFISNQPILQKLQHVWMDILQNLLFTNFPSQFLFHYLRFQQDQCQAFRESSTLRHIQNNLIYIHRKQILDYKALSYPPIVKLFSLFHLLTHNSEIQTTYYG